MSVVTRQYVPDEQWGIVSLADGSEVAGFVHVEDEGRAVEIDVPAVEFSPPNVAVFSAGDVRDAKPMSCAQVLKFVEHHRWPTLAASRGSAWGAEHEGAD